jgi:hypothetical protein
MRKSVLIFAILTVAMVSCKKDEPLVISFNPTDIIISQMGSEMRLSIHGPFTRNYIFSGDPSVLNFTGEDYNVFLIPKNEMEELVKNLSDTIIFQWKMTTAVFPYPEDECKLRVDRSGYGDFMCSIGKGKSASRIIQGLSKSLTGNPKEAFDEIATFLSD